KSLKIYCGTLDSKTSFVNANNDPVTIEADFTATGSVPMNLGTGAVSLGALPRTTRTITITITNAGNPLTLGGDWQRRDGQRAAQGGRRHAHPHRREHLHRQHDGQ
ncbi:MAG TPA: hypothetical protein VGO11_27810, partial [Chthoniobacteraceae bacterium]|nr:hypothetical protein [Chthoniobacteraceae bacterium]